MAEPAPRTCMLAPYDRQPAKYVALTRTWEIDATKATRMEGCHFMSVGVLLGQLGHVRLLSSYLAYCNVVRTPGSLEYTVGAGVRGLCIAEAHRPGC